MTEVMNIMRHESVFNPLEHDYPMHIIGAGATGSRVFAALVELGITNIHVYDPDIVESHNLANQIYAARDIGNPKVDGCKKYAQDKLGATWLPTSFSFNPWAVTPAELNDKTKTVCSGGIVFLLVDKMESRKKIFTALQHRCNTADTDHTNLPPLLVIETRMGATHGSVFSINIFDKTSSESWLKTLVDDTDEDNIELSPCGTTISVGVTASLIANYAVWQMMQFFVDPVGMQPRVDLFFKPTLTITSSSIAA